MAARSTAVESVRRIGLSGGPTSALTTLITRLNGAMMPRFVIRVDSAEPQTKYSAMKTGQSVARLIHWRRCLAGPSEGPRFCLIQFLRHWSFLMTRFHPREVASGTLPTGQAFAVKPFPSSAHRRSGFFLKIQPKCVLACDYRFCSFSKHLFSVGGIGISIATRLK